MRGLLLFIALGAFGFWWMNPGIAVIESAAFDPDLLRILPRIPSTERPVQMDLDGVPPLTGQDPRLQPRALFALEARVLSRHAYRFGRTAEVSNLDLALGWGPMADPEILAHFSISQSGRFYFWRAKQLPIPAAEVIRSSANMHLIAADAAVAAELKRVRADDWVRMHGLLVDVLWDDGGVWRTSLTREDSGAGACEILWVHAIERVWR